MNTKDEAQGRECSGDRQMKALKTEEQETYKRKKLLWPNWTE